MSEVYTVSIRRSKRAKRMSLRVYPQGLVELVLPRIASERAGNTFITSRRQWIERALLNQKKRDAVQKPAVFADGVHIPCFGDSFTLSLLYAPERKRSFGKVRGFSLIVQAKDARAAYRSLQNWYQKEALAYFEGQSQEYANMLGVSIASIRAIDMKSRWGSCNKQTKTLTYNWKLALAPEDVTRYVVAHEVAHLVHANHSKAFWGIVKKLKPDYAVHRAWLKEFGGGLYIKYP